MSRLRSLHALAWSLPDVNPAPTMAKWGAVRGEAPSSWQMCETCDGEGVVEDKFHREGRCPECGGAGRFRVDAFTGLRVGASDSAAPVRTRRVLCDRCGGGGVMAGRLIGESGLVRCDMCDGAGKLSVPVESKEPSLKTFDGTPRSRLRARGDWEALEGALDWLRSQDVRYWRTWVASRVYGRDGNNDLLAALDVFLLEALPNPLRCPRDVLEAFEARHDREAIREARRIAPNGRGAKRTRARELLQRGYSLTEAARLAGCSVKTARRAAA